MKPSPGSAARSRRAVAVSVASLAAALALWTVLTTVTGAIPPAFFPSPAEVWTAFVQIAWNGYNDGRLHEHVWHS